MKILAIETSCDETGISILEVKKPASRQGGSGKKDIFKILANNIHSQVEIHAQYGGVFPALAKREHIKNLPILFEKTIKQAKIKIEQIDAIAVTYGPGLEPALWTGIVFAKELSKKYNIPIVKVNHMEGHIFSIFPKKRKTFTIDSDKKIFPMLSLLVSGGHTELILVKNWHKYKKIGQTRDDAVGEAFDKVARMLGLPYPGGPEVSKLAEIEREKIPLSRGGLKSRGGCIPPPPSGTPQEENLQLPRPMIYSKDYDFSFSGLKTAVLYLIRDLKKEHSDILENVGIKQKIAKEFEDAVVETLVYKTIKAIKEYKIKTLIVGGGVSANKYLQEIMNKEVKNLNFSSRTTKILTKVHFPSKSLTGDNALMIAIAGYFQYKNKKGVKNLNSIKAKGNLSL
ncbi:MAG: tRNA (adenosine(37)-N6)-threonylcarbamoyltransferase complex transferase subunit TsaD [Candidatus Paceibacterota bacterium]